jgi:hypothetical protein
MGDGRRRHRPRATQVHPYQHRHRPDLRRPLAPTIPSSHRPQPREIRPSLNVMGASDRMPQVMCQCLDLAGTGQQRHDPFSPYPVSSPQRWQKCTSFQRLPSGTSHRQARSASAYSSAAAGCWAASAAAIWSAVQPQPADHGRGTRCERRTEQGRFSETSHCRSKIEKWSQRSPRS